MLLVPAIIILALIGGPILTIVALHRPAPVGIIEPVLVLTLGQSKLDDAPEHPSGTDGVVVKHTTAAVLLTLLLAGGVVGCSTTDVADVTVASLLDQDPIAYGYFGSLQIARGGSIITAIDNVASSADIDVASTPDGVTVSIIDADDGTTRVELDITDDAPLGAHAVTFNIVGEPEPVNWTIQITS